MLWKPQHSTRRLVSVASRPTVGCCGCAPTTSSWRSSGWATTTRSGPSTTAIASGCFAYTRQMLGASRSDAEDVLQDVFLRAYGALRNDDRPVTLRAWLYRVAHNRCIDHLRRPDPPAAEIYELSRTPAHDPQAETARREDLRRLVQDVQRLPEQQRSALLMRELDGLTYAELADALDTSVPAIKSLLVRARVGLVEAERGARRRLRGHPRRPRPLPRARRADQRALAPAPARLRRLPRVPPGPARRRRGPRGARAGRRRAARRRGQAAGHRRRLLGRRGRRRRRSRQHGRRGRRRHGRHGHRDEGRRDRLLRGRRRRRRGRGAPAGRHAGALGPRDPPCAQGGGTPGRRGRARQGAGRTRGRPGARRRAARGDAPTRPEPPRRSPPRQWSRPTRAPAASRRRRLLARRWPPPTPRRRRPAARWRPTRTPCPNRAPPEPWVLPHPTPGRRARADERARGVARHRTGLERRFAGRRGCPDRRGHAAAGR